MDGTFIKFAKITVLFIDTVRTWRELGSLAEVAEGFFAYYNGIYIYTCIIKYFIISTISSLKVRAKHTYSEVFLIIIKLNTP